MLLRTALCLLALWQTSARPPHADSCTKDFSGETRLPYPYCNPKLPIDARVNDLLSRMTYAEKSNLLDLGHEGVSRLGVPSMASSESTHGVATGCGAAVDGSTGCPTSFPSGTGLGATFSRKIWSQVGAVIGEEARSLNNQHGASAIFFLDPNVNLCRDPRWGRCQEVPGEDPFLSSEYAVEIIQGTQVSSKDPSYLQAAATVKHFSMYDMEGYMPRTDPQPSPASGWCDTPGGCERWNFDMAPPLRDVVGFYLAPFQAAIERAHAASVMCSYNSAFGRPTCANGLMNNGLLRSEWGFDGVIVSDCTALELFQDVKWDDCQHPYPSEGGHCTPAPFPGGHNFTTTVGETIHEALAVGGVDLNCGSLYKTNLYSQLKAGAVSEEDVDRASARVIRTMIKLGLLDPMDQQPLTRIGPEVVDSAASREVALSAAAESLVLLKNKDNTLPLWSGARVAFIGPHANATQSLLSNYHGVNILVDSNSPLQVAEARGLHVSYSLGCRICDYPYGQNPGFPNLPCPPGHDQDPSMIPHAKRVAAEADVAVVFVGLDQTSEAENFDRNNLELPGVQEQLLQEVMKVQENTVVVLVHGGPLAIHSAMRHASAVLDAFYPGELGGAAIVDALFGNTNPSGRLPYTMYRSDFIARDIRQTDLSANHGITHMWFEGEVLLPFGHGLSYTRFAMEWSDAIVDKTTTSALRQGALTFGVNITNVGERAGAVSALGFVSLDGFRHHSWGRAPRRKLFGFDKTVELKPGESSVLSLSLSSAGISLVADDGSVWIRPGKYHVQVSDGPSLSLDVSGEPIMLQGGLEM